MKEEDYIGDVIEIHKIATMIVDTEAINICDFCDTDDKCCYAECVKSTEKMIRSWKDE